MFMRKRKKVAWMVNKFRAKMLLYKSGYRSATGIREGEKAAKYFTIKKMLF